AASCLASVMNGAGSTNTGAAAAPAKNPMDPFAPARATRPPARTVNWNAAAGAGGRDSAMNPVTPPAVTSYTRSAPSHTPGKVTVDPDTFGMIRRAAPATPTVMLRPPSSTRTNRSVRSPNRVANPVPSLPYGKPATDDLPTAVTM